jgi:hypothetical protein
MMSWLVFQSAHEWLVLKRPLRSKGTTITNGRGYIGLFGLSVATENWNKGFRSIPTDTPGTKEGASIRVHTC